MKGKISVRIRNNKNEYNFSLNCNITILCGDSGSGKTTLYRMVSDYSRAGRASGVHAQVTDDCNITVLEGNFWMDEVRKIQNSIVLVDEDSSFLKSEDFARAIRGSSNYFLLITRNYLYQLPYSVNEIYVIKGRKKKHFERMWQDQERMYHEPWLPILPFKPDLIITEDSNSGFEFFSLLCEKTNIQCLSAKGKSNILRIVKENAERKIAVIADGAAFGAEIEELAEIQKKSNGALALYLPESFEWLVLKSGLVSNSPIPELQNPEEYIDSEKYFSWERYFTKRLMDLSEGDPYKKYSKDRLAPLYRQDASQQKIKKQIPLIQFESEDR